MYPEFVAIYIGLVIIGIISVFNLILTIRVLNNKKKGSGGSMFYKGYANTVFCRKCATEYNAQFKVCPKCGAVR